MPLVKLRRADKLLINMDAEDEVRYWTKHLKVSTEELQKVIDKVGNSAATVRKELSARKPPAAAK